LPSRRLLVRDGVGAMPTTPANTEQKRSVAKGSRWKAAFGFGKSPGEEPPSVDRSRPPLTYSADLRGLLDLVQVVRQRVLTNTFLAGWMVWVSWILVGLISGAAISHRLMGIAIGASSLVVIGGGVSFAHVWSKRPSSYALASKLDAACGLQDRLSTALYFGTPDLCDPMTLRQRRDALRHLPQVDPRVLFPVRMPAFASRTLVLGLLAAALLAYRIHYNPPIASLVQRVANSRVETAILSPLVGVVKKDLQALVDRQPEVQQAAADAETVPGLPDAKDGDDPSQANKDAMAPDGDWDEDSQAGHAGEPGEAGDPQTADGAAQAEGQDASQADGSPQNQQSADANQPSPSENGNQSGASEQQQSSDQQSAANSVLQALKNLMKNMAGQASTSPGESGGQPSAAGSSQQAGNSPGQGAKSENSKDSSDQKDSGSSPGSKKPGGGAGNGSTPVPKQAPKSSPPPPSNTVADRVDLEANNFRQQGRIRTTSAAGTAQLPLRDIKPQPVAAIKGPEQENIPVRYRLYVQRYFEHADKAPE
jgi:hypothetical protein